MENRGRSEAKLNQAVTKYLQRYGCLDSINNRNWSIKQSPLGGFGVFATRTIEAGEIIFTDHPVILGPRCLSSLPVQCTVCYRSKTPTVSKCPNKCGLHVCEECSKSQTHASECALLGRLSAGRDMSEHNERLTRSLTPLRGLLLDADDLDVVGCLVTTHAGPRPGGEALTLVEELRLGFTDEEYRLVCFVCGAFDANAFEVLTNEDEARSTIRGLYPLGSLANHRCFPNAFHVFDGNYRMITRASVEIPESAEIFHSYTRLLWGTVTRIHHLRNSKRFLCKCERCKDPTEFGTCLSALNCNRCPGKVLPVDPARSSSSWRCDTCSAIRDLGDISKTLSLIGAVIKGFAGDDFDIIYRFLTTKLTTLVPDCNQVAVELKYNINWILGYKSGYLLNEIPLDLLLIKKQYCDDILKLVDQLRLGKCRIKGLLCYEVYLCNEELKRRRIANGNNDEIVDDNEANIKLEEAADILKYDFSAPPLLKQRFNHK
ncbi:unnamed protein product [Phyllotreta striolata]|uniref:SET domain-containing protein n=1 Tax=Phyllotreta striolata TaxID=444603 RepID=A0A9N9TNJ8_PHYSR|nr:unnamed protein product [Phyllotreta striolata]